MARASTIGGVVYLALFTGRAIHLGTTFLRQGRCAAEAELAEEIEEEFRL
jgi:hypothetical protein